jgi:integrase
MERIKTNFRGVYMRFSEGRLFKNKPDVCFDITYKAEGKKVWEKIGWLSEGYSAKLADNVRSERLRSLRHGIDLPKKKEKAPLFKDIAKKYMKWAETNKTRGGRDDELRYKKHLAHRFDDKRLSEIAPLDLERMKSELTKRGYAPATVEHCLILFRQIFNKAVEWNLYNGNNPIKKVKMPVVQNQRERFLSYSEADELLKKLAMVSTTVHDAALLSLHTGMRTGEIFSLKGHDIDLDNNLITISDPKNKESRKAYMTPTIHEMLKARKPEKPDDLVFKRRRGQGRINSISATFRQVVRDMGLNAGIKDRRQTITFHSLRHTHASWLAIQGTPILTISHLLGHKSLEMTRKYAHLSPDSKKAAVLNLEQKFNEAITENGV